MSSVRDRGGRAEYLKEFRAEQIEEKKAARADPVARAQAALDAAALATREALLTQRIDSLFGELEHVNGREINESVALGNWGFWAKNGGRAAGFQKHHAYTVLTVQEKNDLAPTALNFSVIFQLLKEYDLLPEAPVQAAPAVEAVPPSVTAEQQYKARMTEIVVYDPLDNKGYTEFDLENRCDSKTELRLRRLMEGKIGNERYGEFLQVKDIQAEKNARIAAQEEQ